MDQFTSLVVQFVHDMPTALQAMSATLGVWLYVVLFLIVFAETGLVVTPFLPGDSLLFAVGAVAAMPESGLSVLSLVLVLIAAATLGDALNYTIGRRFGRRLFSNPSSRWFRRDHLEKTERFYEKHGGKTIILARFVPIVRTYAPFVAGLGAMSYREFLSYNVGGAILWVCSVLLLGWKFGNLPAVKTNFHYVVVGIIVVSVLPILIEWARARFWRHV